MSIYVSKIFQNFTSPQVQKLGLQAAQKTARISAAGYFYITRNTITRVIWKFRYFHIFLFELERYILSFLGVWHEPSLHLPLGQVWPIGTKWDDVDHPAHHGSHHHRYLWLDGDDRPHQDQHHRGGGVWAKDRGAAEAKNSFVVLL